MSLLESAIEKLEKRIETKEDRQEEESLQKEERDDQFHEESEDAVRELKRFMRSDEYLDALVLLKTIEDYNISGSIGEEIANKLSEEIARLENKAEALRKKIGSGIGDNTTRFDAIQEKIWSLQEQSGRVKKISHKIEICSTTGPNVSTISYYFAPDGFTRNRCGELSKAKLEEIVKYFSRIDQKDKWPSKLLPTLRKKINATAELLELL